ncbi:MAG: hypothetical protein HFI86_05795 [Bacilli bacterium]|nr:hypothetical protein [Bacilli bacterium]
MNKKVYIYELVGNTIDGEKMGVSAKIAFNDLLTREEIQKIRSCKYLILCDENGQLKPRLQSKKLELNGFVTTISKYLEFEEPEHTTYDEIIEKIVNLKDSTIKLQQNQKVIKISIKEIKNNILELNKQIDILEKKEDRMSALVLVAVRNSFYSIEEILEKGA